MAEDTTTHEAEGQGFVVWIDGKRYTLEDFTLEEAELLEDTFDCPIDEIDFGRAKAVRMLIWIVKRREDPSFTLEDAGKIRVSQIGPPVDDDEPAEVEAETAKGKKKRPTKGGASASA